SCARRSRSTSNASATPATTTRLRHPPAPRKVCCPLLSLAPLTAAGHTKIPDCATFPNGLPAAVAVAAESSSESDHCLCKSSAACHCCVPRKPAARPRRKDPAAVPTAASTATAPAPPSTRTPSHILARLAELRPVLPRPAHDPSSARHPAPRRAHAHDLAYFSPYGRAYDDHQQHHPHHAQPPAFPDDDLFRDAQAAQPTAAATAPWLPPLDGALVPAFPSTCGCGDACSCPGCVHHNPDVAPASTAFSSCANPGACTTCLDCTILALPPSLPADTALSIYDLQTSLDDWIRDVSARDVGVGVGVPDVGVSVGVGDVDVLHDPQPWEYTPAPAPAPAHAPTHPHAPSSAYGYTIKPCCGALCKCDPETCECNIDDAHGYDCRREMLFPTFGAAHEAGEHAHERDRERDREHEHEGEGEDDHEREREREHEHEHEHERGYDEDTARAPAPLVRGRLGYFTASHAHAPVPAHPNAHANAYDGPGRFLAAYTDPPRSRSSSTSASTSTASSHSHSHSQGHSHSQHPHTHSQVGGNLSVNVNGSVNGSGSGSGSLHGSLGGLRLHAEAPPHPHTGRHGGSVSPSPGSFEFEYE
ncbi:hypothetical protein C0992_011843, partial [Termitomyces sp. T32_za158]